MSGWSRTERIIGAILALVGGFFFITCSGQVWLFQIPFLLVTGWVGFLLRVLPEVTFRWGLIVEAVAVGTVLGVGTHLFLRWVWRHLRPEEAWPARWSASVVVLLVLLFGATMSTVGIGHHLGWLRGGRTPLLQRSWRFSPEARESKSLCEVALRRSASGVSDTQMVPALLREPGTQEFVERLHVLPLRGPGGEPGFLVFPRDPLLRERAGGVRCGGGLEQDTPVQAVELPRLLSEGRVAAGTVP